MMDRWSLPERLEIAGHEYTINADFRDVLEIIHWLTDPNEQERVRLYVALRLFYDDFETIPPDAHQEAADLMMEFIAGGKKDEGPPGPRLLDWDQDQGMIVADVNKVAGCEIRALPFSSLSSAASVRASCPPWWESGRNSNAARSWSPGNGSITSSTRLMWI